MRDLHALNAERRGRFTIGYMFFMGARYSAGYAGNTSHESDDELIEREATAYGDILRLDVGDSYLNHTRKVVAGISVYLTPYYNRRNGPAIKTNFLYSEIFGFSVRMGYPTLRRSALSAQKRRRRVSKIFDF